MMQLQLGIPIDDKGVGARQLDNARGGKALGQLATPCAIAWPALIRSNNRFGDQPVSADEMLDQSAGDAETDDRLCTERNLMLECPCEPSGLSARCDRADASTRRNAGFLQEARDSDDNGLAFHGDAQMPKRGSGPRN